MGKLFLMFIFLSAIVSCGKSEENNKCDVIICPTTAYCSNGICILKEGRCVTKNDCTNDYICDVNFNCVNPNNPCEGKICSNHGTCSVSNDLAQCNCDMDYISDGLSCVAKPCTNGETKTSSCGSDGEVQTQICQYGTWRVQGVCSCVNASKRTQSCNGDGIQYQTCNNGIWTNTGECIGTTCSTEGELRDLICGFNTNGVQKQICNNNKWTNIGICIDPDKCANGTTQLVVNEDCEELSLNGRGKSEQICVNGQWLDYENCKDPDICEDWTQESIEGICGFNNRGTKYKECVYGQWDFNNDYCNDIDVCVDNNTQIINCGGFNLRAEQTQKCILGQWQNEGNCIDPDTASFMDIYEVTVGEFKQCVTAGSCTNSNYDTYSELNNCNMNKAGKENNPMNCVNLEGATQYCSWKGKLLPTEAEWEYAAKGGETYIYSGSDNINEVAWYSANSGDTTHQVGTKAPNGYGLYDMSGNILEWTNSWYDSTYTQYVLKGGSFEHGDSLNQIDKRISYYPSSTWKFIGFRCIKSE